MSHNRTVMDFIGLGMVNSRPSASLPSISRLKSAQVTFCPSTQAKMAWSRCAAPLLMRAPKQIDTGKLGKRLKMFFTRVIRGSFWEVLL